MWEVSQRWAERNRRRVCQWSGRRRGQGIAALVQPGPAVGRPPSPVGLLRGCRTGERQTDPPPARAGRPRWQLVLGQHARRVQLDEEPPSSRQASHGDPPWPPPHHRHRGSGGAARADHQAIPRDGPRRPPAYSRRPERPPSRVRSASPPTSRSSTSPATPNRDQVAAKGGHLGKCSLRWVPMGARPTQLPASDQRDVACRRIT